MAKSFIFRGENCPATAFAVSDYGWLPVQMPLIRRVSAATLRYFKKRSIQATTRRIVLEGGEHACFLLELGVTCSYFLKLMRGQC